MDCEAVERENIPERYLAGTLDPDLKAQWELHYFSCGRCAELLATWQAIDRPLRFEGVKLVRCPSPAPIFQAVFAPTKLPALGRINALKPDARAVDFERVAINDAGLPGQIVRERRHSTNASRREDRLRKRDSSERQFERPNLFSANVLMLCKRICIA